MNESRITPKGIIDDAIGMIGKMQESAFPLDVFPNPNHHPENARIPEFPD